MAGASPSPLSAVVAPAIVGVVCLCAFGASPVIGALRSGPATNDDPDEIVLTHNHKAKKNPPSPETVVMLDANSGEGCLKDVVRTTDLGFANLVDHGDCGPDEIVVFSGNDPVVVDDGNNGQIWTDAAAEQHTIDLGTGRLEVPVIIWQAVETRADGRSVSSLAHGDIATANVLYNAQRAGIHVRRVRTEHIAKHPELGSLGNDCPTTMPPNVVRPDTINVYYVPALTGAVLGVQCRDADWNVIFISVAARNDNTLAHELGHAFSLEHTGQAATSWYVDGNGTPLLDANNLMWGDSQIGAFFTLGQVFRVNLDPISSLHRNGIRGIPTRTCECHLYNGGCDSKDGAHNRFMYLQESDKDGVCPRISRGWQ